MSHFSIKRPVTVFMLIVTLIVGGVIFATRLPVEQMPEMEFPVAMVATSVPGATPSEVEELVTKPIESGLASIQNVDTIQSQSGAGSSLVMVMFNYGVDLDQATLDMRDSLDRVRGVLPDSANSPQVLKMDINSMPIINLAFTGEQDVNKLQPIAEDIIQPQLERIPGVASVSITGGQERLIRVTIDPASFGQYGISLDQISQALAANNISGSGGSVTKGNSEIQIRVQGEYQAVSEIAETPINIGTSTIRLKDIATVEDSLSDVTTISTFNGTPSINISVTKASGGNTLQIARAVKDSLKSIADDLPEGTKLEMVTDASEPVSDSVSLLLEHAVIGLIIAAVILLLFLNSTRSTIIAAIVIPISFVATFMMMYFSGQTINIISLGGLLLGLGSFVDFSVVIIENIFRHRHEGKSMMQGALEGSKQVGNAVMASALAQIVVFLPIVFVEGMAGEIFKPLALTVIFSHIAALVVSLMIVPMLSSRFLPKLPDESVYTSGTYKGKNPIVWFNIFFEKVKTAYGKSLKWSLGHKKMVLIGTVLLFIGSAALLPLVKFEFIPEMDEGQMTVAIEMPKGAKLEDTEQAVSKIEQTLLDIPELENVTATIGSGGGYGSGQATNEATLTATLVDERKRSTGEVASEVRQKVDNIPDAEITVSGAASLSTGSAVQINLTGDDMEVLRELSNQIVSEVKKVEGTVNAASSLDAVREEYTLSVDTKMAARYGLSTPQVLSAVRTSFEGTVATSYRTGDDQIDVEVAFPKQYQQDYSYLESLRIATAQGLDVPLMSVAKLELKEVPDTITRKNQARQVSITADIEGNDLVSVNSKIAAMLDKLHLPDGYSVDTGGGEQEQMMESFMSLGIAILLSVALIYMVMAGQFESLFTPFVIMFSIPTSLIGVIVGLVVTGSSLSIIALIGYIMLVGLVVNNAIVMIDFVIQLRQEGMGGEQAVLLAATERIRPILMTTLATVLSLFPMAFSHDVSNATMAPMAVVVVFGLSFSALITLFLVPVVYIVFDNIIAKRKDRKMKKQQQKGTNAQMKLEQESIQA
ncbi:efflux RND transporter permease subunit [Paenibacillus sanguinis]|uniref:efflux RND transporter permease subunit n=1 Tax=Paenibacillus sanguinis TaxID=225906 RepID=UPI0003825794|nr:efflux RND transporter permease subunit [Paenibacillus sanguinis]